MIDSNKPRAVHYALIVFVMSTVVLGMLTYINMRELSDTQELLAPREQEIARLRNVVKATDDREQSIRELEQANGILDDDLRAAVRRIKELETVVEQQKAQIKELKEASKEAADGAILRVDSAAKVVWINLGAADFLKPGTTFGVYSISGALKGKIEVTRILGQHLSEARIIEEELAHPMAASDQLISTTWNPGQREVVSVAGVIDMDEDGKSDRDEFKKLLELSACIIEVEIDDEGHRIPADAKVTPQSKFLLLGEVPEPDPLDEDDKARVTRIQQQMAQAIDEAKASGVRAIKLRDFMTSGSHFGKSQQPTQERPINLKAGAAADSSERDSNGKRFGNKRNQ